jgi:integrase
VAHLRHTAATLWIKAGADLHGVSRRLGHASAAFTMDTYGHLVPGMQRQAAEALYHVIRSR